jgi:hypothetical protein
MSAHGRVVLFGAVVFALAMGALEHGGWWWAWLTASTIVLLGRGVRLPRIGVRLSATNRFIRRESRRVRRHNRELAQHQRHRQRQQHRAHRARRRQTQ